MLEVCVDTVQGLHAAYAGGADRIELCAALSEGGLSPSMGLMRAAAKISTPSHVMIRPRRGDFRYGPDDLAVMLADIAAVNELRLAGVVFGALTQAGDLDEAVLEPLLQASKGLSVTLHRAIDLAADPLAALRRAEALGFHTVLTSGGQPTAAQGAAMIAKMVAQSAGHMTVMAGSGLRPDTIGEVIAATGAPAYHASCRAPLECAADHLGFTGNAGRYETSSNVVAEMAQQIRQARQSR